MKAEDLNALGITGETAERVIAMNAAELAAETDRNEKITKELETSKATVKEITEKLKAYDGVNVDELKKQAADWETKYNADINALKFDHALDAALSSAKARNPKAVRGMLDMKALSLTKNGNIDGLTEQLEALRKSDGYMFESDEPIPQISRETKGGTSAGIDDSLRAAFGLPVSK